MDAVPIQHIEITNGKAVIAGTHLKAAIVAAMVVRAGATIDETMAQYTLTRAQVHSALAYYYDHQNTIEQAFEDAENYVRQTGVPAEQHLHELRKRHTQSTDN
ncbi:MAG: DUF433 domain-containing protein [Anaerolineae bacterium]|nr:DUF433 domain-containing protein [Anaerolineae bacterium]